MSTFSSSGLKTYLFSYPFDGHLKSLEIKAESEDDAKREVKAMGRANFDGILGMTIPVPIGLGWFALFIIWCRDVIRYYRQF